MAVKNLLFLAGALSSNICWPYKSKKLLQLFTQMNDVNIEIHAKVFFPITILGIEHIEKVQKLFVNQKGYDKKNT